MMEMVASVQVQSPGPIESRAQLRGFLQHSSRPRFHTDGVLN